MKSRTLTRIVSLLFAAALVVNVGACAKTPASVKTPQGKAAFQADQVVVRLDRIESAIIQASTPNAAGVVGLDKAAGQLIVSFIVDALKVIKQSPNGWMPAVAQAWTQAKARIPANVLPQVQGYVFAIDTLLAGASSVSLNVETSSQLALSIATGEHWLTE